jgi:uncharacterized membrane protein
MFFATFFNKGRHIYTRVLNVWENFRSSFWFLPSILMVAATVSAYLLVTLDSTTDNAIVDAFPILEMSPPAARSILSSIVGAMISATGVVFSMTIVALTLASSQFGSRLIRTYRGRKSTHFTLGIFVSTSLYCILVLACIREVEGFSFVPTLSVGVGILLTVVCLATLIYYIHDLSYAIQASSVIDKSADDLNASIKRLFPTKIGDQVKASSAEAKGVDNSALESAEEMLGRELWKSECDRVGYVQAIEEETVMSLAGKHDIVIHLLIQPGDFVYKELDLAVIHGGRNDSLFSDEIQEQITEKIGQCLIIGNNRTPTQDVRYAFNELVEVAVRALSPGINDPFTAINCVDQIHAALREMRRYAVPSPYRVDKKGVIRVVVEPIAFEVCLKGSLGVIADYAKDNPMVKSRVELAMESFV